MSKSLKVAALLSCSLGCASALQAADSLPDTNVAEAQALAIEFIGQLKPQLKEAMATGGPGKAIEVCASVAPAIADSLTASSGWTVKRVSLNARNASRATPDAWERQVLEQFDLRQVAGEAPADLHYSQEVNGQFRYLQAQGVDTICLTCHGQALTALVSDTLQQYYPDDRATGYSLGQVRGAISVSKSLSP
jgi:hypothetical protein